MTWCVEGSHNRRARRLALALQSRSAFISVDENDTQHRSRRRRACGRSGSHPTVAESSLASPPWSESLVEPMGHYGRYFRFGVVVASRQMVRDLAPKALWQLCHRIPQGACRLLECVVLRLAGGTIQQVCLDLFGLPGADGMKHEGREELGDVIVAHQRPAPSIPASSKMARIFRIPVRILLFTVSSG